MHGTQLSHGNCYLKEVITRENYFEKGSLWNRETIFINYSHDESNFEECQQTSMDFNGRGSDFRRIQKSNTFVHLRPSKR